MLLQYKLLQEVRDVLLQSGYSILIMEREAFDIIAKRDEKILLAKVLANVDSYGEEQARNLKTMASVLNATPIIIAVRGRNFRVEDDVIYERFNIPVVSVSTFKRIIEGEEVFTLSKKGKRIASVDASKVRDLRKSREMSMDDLAERINVTKKTIYLMEREGKASLEVVEKIENFFDERITKPINIFEWKFQPEKERPSTTLERKFDRFMLRYGFRCYFVKRAPADAMNVAKEEKKKEEEVIATKICLSTVNRRAVARFKSFADFCSVHKFLLTRESRRKGIEGVATIGLDELSDIEEADELVKLIKEKEEK